VLICVPTPVTKSKEPDLSYVKSAAEIVGENLKKNATVVLESTVYPGVTEELVKPILEKESGMYCGTDFYIGYSPERINPGDEAHTLDKITKVVAGMDAETTARLAELYGLVTTVYKARDIKTAEAAKVIENIQRDLNIALMNELALIFQKLGLDTKSVLEAAGTKWNFHQYKPGLVGGHCIPVDPYYLVYKAKELGYHPQVILAGRAINDYMAKHVAAMAIKGLNSLGKAKSDTELSNYELVLRKRQALAGVTVPYKLIWHTARNKRARIESLEPFYSSGQLQFLESWNVEYPQLLEQLIHFPLAAHDDGAQCARRCTDALAGVIELITEYTAARRASKREVLYPRAR